MLYVFLLAYIAQNNSSDQLKNITSLKEKYKIKSKDFKYEREFLLNSYISKCLWDGHLSEGEKKQLLHLAELLDINDDYLNRKITEEGKIIYTDHIF